jgi:uncharacterized ubiquitin-like protein YukD
MKVAIETANTYQITYTDMDNLKEALRTGSLAYGWEVEAVHIIDENDQVKVYTKEQILNNKAQ